MKIPNGMINYVDSTSLTLKRRSKPKRNDLSSVEVRRQCSSDTIGHHSSSLLAEKLDKKTLDELDELEDEEEERILQEYR